MAAGLPVLIWFAALCELGPIALAMLLLLPAAVAFGGGALALAVSTVARTARDALLIVYLCEFLFLLAPLFAGRLSARVRQWIEPLNPYQAIRPLVEFQDVGPALMTIGLWTLIGALGCAWAAWRLRPSFLSSMDEPRRRWRLFRRSRSPVLADRPMLWKELYVEQVMAFGRIVKWLGILVVAAFSGTSLFLAGLYAWRSWFDPDPEQSQWALAFLTDWLGWSWLTAWLIQWALGLRAAAAITTERQRGTWDALLVSPLEAREILWAKIYGSIYGLRGLLAALVLAWSAGLICGAMTIGAFIELLAQTLLIGGFMLTAGIAFSLLLRIPHAGHDGHNRHLAGRNLRFRRPRRHPDADGPDGLDAMAIPARHVAGGPRPDRLARRPLPGNPHGLLCPRRDSDRLLHLLSLRRSGRAHRMRLTG